MPIIERDRSTLYFEVYGSGRPLLFLHGVGGNTLVWWQQIPFFKERYRCILVDQRGWGRSRGLLPLPWVDAFVPDLEAILENLGIEEFAVIAQSMGGWTVNAFHQANPERIRAAVMTGTTGGYVPLATKPAYENARNRVRDMRSLWCQGRGPHPALGSRIYDEQPALAQLYEMLTALNRPASTDPDLGLPLTSSHFDLLENVLFVYGEEDLVCPRDIIETTAAEISGSTIHSIARSGHSAHFERADAFNREVSDFLNGCYK